MNDREFLVLVGPSGCGKSTALRLVAGLETPTEGGVYIGGALVNRLPPKDRDIAMVFQSYALYPHKNVYENIAFPLKLKKISKEEVDDRVKEAAELLGISPLLDRKPRELSGGQRQRVALGRAIVRKPRVFLMDEPLSNLDAKLRVSMRAELKRLQDKLKVTTIYVTHDQVEAMTMGDRIAIMKDGVLNQVGTPSQVFERPVNRFVAGFIGSPPMNFLDATVIYKDGGAVLDFEDFTIGLEEKAGGAVKKYEGKEVSVGIRPTQIYDKGLARDPKPEWTVEAEVDVVEPLGTEIIVHLRRGGREFVAQISSESEVMTGGRMDIVIDGGRLHIFDIETEEAVV